MSITKKKYKLTKIGANTYFLELMFVLLNIFQQQKLMNKKHVDRDLIFEEKREEAMEKNLTVSLLELIRVKVLMKIMELVEQKHLLVNFKTSN